MLIVMGFDGCLGYLSWCLVTTGCERILAGSTKQNNMINGLFCMIFSIWTPRN